MKLVEFLFHCLPLVLFLIMLIVDKIDGNWFMLLSMLYVIGHILINIRDSIDELKEEIK